MVKIKKRRLSKGKLKHGGYTYLQTGQLPEDKLYIGVYLTRLRAGYIEDIGPREEDLTAGQLLLVNKLITLEGWCRCVEVEAARKQTLDLRDRYTKFTNLVLKICGMLGIERRAGVEDGKCTEKEFLKAVWEPKEGKDEGIQADGEAVKGA